MDKKETRKTVIVLTVAVVIVIIVVMVFRSISITKKTNKPGTLGVVETESSQSNNNSDVEVLVTETENMDGLFKSSTSNTSGVEGLKVEDAMSEVVNEESTDAQSENTEVLPDEQEVGNPETELPQGSDVLTEVDAVNIENRYTSDALVSSKKMYLLDDSSYVYSLELLFPVGSEYRTVKYLCSVASWNSVSMNESISVEYGLDDHGRVIILGLAKK